MSATPREGISKSVEGLWRCSTKHLERLDFAAGAARGAAGQSHGSSRPASCVRSGLPYALVQDYLAMDGECDATLLISFLRCLDVLNGFTWYLNG